MSAKEGLDGIVVALGQRGLPQVEVYHKRGRSRRLERLARERGASLRSEEGWAVRAGGDRASLFLATTTPPAPEGPWPEPDGSPLRLPDRGRSVPWSGGEGFDEPIASESEAAALLDAVERGLSAELPGARLLAAQVEDGASESSLANSRGVEARWRSRSATLRITASTPDGGTVASLELMERSARRFQPTALARRVADLLVLRRDGRPPERDRGEAVLAPAVATRVLAGLIPLLLGPSARHRAAGFLDRQGRLGSREVTLVDDGRLPGGLFAASVDGEGVPTREMVLVEQGRWRQPLLAWWEVRDPSERPSGCSPRPSWRDVPRPGPTHLFLRPDRAVRVADLVGGISRGFYLLEADSGGWIDLELDRFALPVCGFEVRDGRATAPLAGAWLQGPAGSFLHRIRSVARDLTFHPLAGMLGSGTLLVSGLGLEPEPPQRPSPVSRV